MSSRFETAPGWYRALLRLERRTLRLGYRRLRPGRGLQVRPAGVDPSNLALNELGNLIPERAVPGSAPGWVMGQHVARYAWAMQLVDGLRVVELGSGAGYGTSLLSWSAASVVGVDLDADAVARAAAAYDRPEYRVADITDASALPEADVAVCFEVLEHVDRPDAVLAAAIQKYHRLLLSFPNPLMHGSHLNPHHRVDWPLRELRAALRRAGATSVRTFHQGRRDPAIRRGATPLHSIWILDVSGRQRG